MDVDVDDEVEPSIKYKCFMYLKFDIFVELLLVSGKRGV